VLRPALALAALWLVISSQAYPATEEGPAKQTTVLILLDGFRADRLNADWAPRLDRLARSGAHGAMVPIWPSLSRPNHWALVTGLHAASSGVWQNEMYDPVANKPIEVSDRNWGFGEPIWATLAREGRIAGVLGAWTGASLKGDRAPSFYVMTMAPENPGERDGRAAMALTLLDQRARARPELLALYYYDVDVVEHRFGVDSDEAKAATRHVDAQIGELIDGLAARGLSKTVNVVVVADHGHMNLTGENVILARHIDLNDLITKPVGAGPIFGLWPKPGKEAEVLAKLKRAHPKLTVYRANEIPREFHCCRADRTPPILIVADDGVGIEFEEPKEPRQTIYRGSHAYDINNPEMHAVFVAAGPAIRAGVTLPRFSAVNVYSLLAELVQVSPQHNDGTIQPFCQILLERPAACELSPRVERLDQNRIRVSWTADEPVDVLIADRADVAPTHARRVATGVTSGHHVVQAPAKRRAYIMLRGATTGRTEWTSERVLPLATASNYRDLGGYKTADGRRVRWGRIYRSGATPLLGSKDLAYVRTLGIESMVDLRSVQERELAPNRLPDRTTRYFTQDYSYSALLEAGRGEDGRVTSSALYRSWLILLAPQFRIIFKELSTGRGAVALNCTAGQDRTGVATALILSALGVPRDTILEDYHLSTISRHPENEMPEFDPVQFPDNPAALPSAKTRLATPQPLHDQAGRAHLEEMFDEVDRRWGSVDAYLTQQLGVGPRELEQLRASYLQ
jgi:protein-tyrosine phosphatase